VLGRPFTLCALFGVLTFGRAPVALAEDVAAADAGVTAESSEPAPPPVRWHGSLLYLKQRVGTQTVGVGADYQSRNPFYDAAIYFLPRYYLWEREPSSLSLRAQLIGTYEVTNSDTTTKRGEVLLEDSVLSLVPEHVFGTGESKTLVAVSVPRLVLPTSFASRRAGKIIDAGARVVVDHGVPLRKNSKVLPRGRLAARVGYSYQFVTGSVPSSDTISRLRMALDGNTARNSQLSGAAFADHSGVLRGIVGADVYSDWLSFDLELGVDPAHKRRLSPAVVTGLPTGPYEARSTNDPQRVIVVTYLDTAFSFTIEQTLRLAVGYENITSQLGDDGQRRNVFYSPDAKFYLAAELTLDKAYDAFRGPSSTKQVARAH
jgi:hypothetical protein